MRPHFAVMILTSLATAGLITSCSSASRTSQTSAEELSTTGPTILNVRTEPGTFEVTRELSPLQAPVILADVKDLTSKVQSVRLQFQRVPIVIDMKRVAGTTWQATLTPEQIRQLAVSGETMNYRATITARNALGRSGESAALDVRVKAPEVSVTG